nr:alpha/beta hydrolase [uncultured Actinotalea sp.]
MIASDPGLVARAEDPLAVLITEPRRHPAAGPACRRNAVTLVGARRGLPLVLGPGFGCDQSMWRHVVPAFADDHPVALLDHVGAGASDVTAYSSRRHSELTGYAEDLVEVLEELDLGPVVFVGHSASGMIGARAAAARPELFRGLVLIGASPRYVDAPGWTGGFTEEDVEGVLRGIESDFAGFVAGLAPLAMGHAERPELAAELHDSMLGLRHDIALEFARAIFLGDHRCVLPLISTPTLVIQPAEDPMVPEVAAEQMAAAIPGSRYRRLAATGHYPHLSSPDETSDVIRSFLATLA